MPDPSNNPFQNDAKFVGKCLCRAVETTPTKHVKELVVVGHSAFIAELMVLNLKDSVRALEREKNKLLSAVAEGVAQRLEDAVPSHSESVNGHSVQQGHTSSYKMEMRDDLHSRIQGDYSAENSYKSLGLARAR